MTIVCVTTYIGQHISKVAHHSTFATVELQWCWKLVNLDDWYLKTYPHQQQRVRWVNWGTSTVTITHLSAFKWYTMTNLLDLLRGLGWMLRGSWWQWMTISIYDHDDEGPRCIWQRRTACAKYITIGRKSSSWVLRLIHNLQSQCIKKIAVLFNEVVSPWLLRLLRVWDFVLDTKEGVYEWMNESIVALSSCSEYHTWYY